jgi:integrase
MRLEPHDNKDDAYRAWLNETECDLLRDFYAGKQKLAILLMLDSGLRSKETTRVTLADVRRLDSDEEAYKLGVYGKDTTGELDDGKWRETPITTAAREKIETLASMKGQTQHSTPIDVTERTVQQWVEDARQELADETGDDDWHEVSAHDLRRTWATRTYYRLHASDVAKSVVMAWGGWSKQKTFEQNYLGREPDDLAAKMMETAGLR